jgi:hypothetical protein
METPEILAQASQNTSDSAPKIRILSLIRLRL